MTSEAENLLKHYLYQMSKLLTRAGVTSSATWDRSSALYGRHMEKMADVTKDWDVEAGVLMEACFAMARKQKHPNGPMPNAMGSSKYLTNALMHHLELPYEAVVERRTMLHVMSDMDRAYEKSVRTLEGHDVSAIAMMTSVPAVHRLVYCRPGNSEIILHLSPEVLDHVADKRTVELWLRHRGVPYELIATEYNNLLKRNNEQQEV